MNKYRLTVFAVLFCVMDYLLPLFCSTQAQLLLLLLAYFPGLHFVLSWLCGIICGFRWQYAPFTALLMLPPILVYFNATALWFILIYAALTLIGSFLGSLWRKK